jgi:polysaccharide export outer membrane protein
MSKKYCWFLFLILLFLTLISPILAEEIPVTTAPETVAQPEAAVKDLTVIIRINDTLEITVYNEPELCVRAQIDKDGNVRLPLAGSVPVAGLTEKEAQEKIWAVYDKDYLVNPSISVVNLTVKQEAEKKAAELQKKTAIPEKKIELQKPVTAKEETIPKDTYIIMGQVKKPGTYQHSRKEGKMTLLKAIAMADGFTNIANIAKVKLVHSSGPTTRAVMVNVNDVMSGKQADEVLEGDCLIFVPESIF